ncbi:MAG: rhomboid family intramembrane serine protease, partial [Burkholderiaceae bacterium]
VDSHGQVVGVAEGEWWRLITATFLHYGPLHLGLNMLALWWFGAAIEQVLGRGRYLLLYVVSGLAGAAGALIFSPTSPTVGASGALFGLLLSFGMLFPDRIIVPLFPPIPMKAKYFVAIFGALELLLGIYGGGGIAHFAHLGGMLGAYLLIRYWRTARRR